MFHSKAKDWLNRLRKGQKSFSAERPSLPEHVVNILREQDIPRLLAWLRDDINTEDVENELTALHQTAKEVGWDAQLLDKLMVFSNYHRGKLQQSFEQAQKYLNDANFDPDVFIIACLTLYHANQFSDAKKLLYFSKNNKQLLEHRIDYLLVAALIHLSTNNRHEAIKHFESVLEIDPEDTTTLFNCYSFYFELGEIEKFQKIKQKIQDKKYNLSEAALAVAYVELAQNNYPEGFRLMELRYDMPSFKHYLNRALLLHPRWQQEPLDGRALLITAEQGLGDTIMISRYFPEISKLTNSFHVECQTEALSLLTYNFPGISIIPTKYGELNTKDFDVWVASLSLPYIFKSSSTNVPGKEGYLRTPPDYKDYWNKRVFEIARGNKPKIGIAWSGQPAHGADQRRSLPTRMVFPLISSLPDIDFFALQTFVPPDIPDNLFNVSEEMATLADTAALIEEMDLVITVDTSIVHLAGALGKPTWLLLPYRYEWRWGTEGESNAWYASVHVLRQPSPGAWAPILSKAFGRKLSQYLAVNYWSDHEVN